MRFAAKHNRHNMKDILAQNGSLNQSSRDDRRSNQKSVPSDHNKFKNVKTNERMQKKTYVLQVYDGQQYRPISKEEFDKFAQDEPELTKIFEDQDEIAKLEIP